MSVNSSKPKRLNFWHYKSFLMEIGDISVKFEWNNAGIKCVCKCRFDGDGHAFSSMNVLTLLVLKPDYSGMTKIQWNFVMVLFITYSADHNEILHTSRQLHCHDVCKIPLWSAEYILNQSTAYFGRISNSIEISLVGRAPGQFHGRWCLVLAPCTASVSATMVFYLG